MEKIWFTATNVQLHILNSTINNSLSYVHMHILAIQ